MTYQSVGGNLSRSMCGISSVESCDDCSVKHRMASDSHATSKKLTSAEEVVEERTGPILSPLLLDAVGESACGRDDRWWCVMRRKDASAR